MGLDTAVTLQRAGFRVKNRRLEPKKLPPKHRISTEEAIEFVKNAFGIEVEE